MENTGKALDMKGLWSCGMTDYAEHKDRYWAAQERLNKSLNTFTDTFSVRKAAWLFLSRNPWRLLKLAYSLFEYIDFKSHVTYLYDLADKIRNKKNSELADAIIERTCLSLLNEDRRDWAEISGLAAQKLAHLKYHEDLKRKRFKAVFEHSKLRRL